MRALVLTLAFLVASAFGQDAGSSRRAGGMGLGRGPSSWLSTQEPRAKVLPKLRGRIWIDKAEMQWVKVDVTTTDTISFGLFLARIHQGARIVVEVTRVNEEVWLPKHVGLHIDVRLALLKNYNRRCQPEVS